MNNFKRKMEASAFDTYDPDAFDNDGVVSDLYDPDFATGQPGADPAVAMRTARPGKKLQINISITNATAVKLKAELFSAFDSWTTRLKPEYVVAPYNMVPALSLQGIAALVANPLGGNVVGYAQDGSLEVRGAPADPKMTIGCGEYPYNSLVDSTKTLPFYVSYIRYTVSTDAQIDNNIDHFTRTFGGGVKSNPVSPRAYFKPNQFQNKTIDILAPFSIDGESGLLIPMEAGENVRLALFIQRWGKNTI